MLFYSGEGSGTETWTDQDAYELVEHRHLLYPWPGRSPVQGVQVDGRRPVMVVLYGREVRVKRVLDTYSRAASWDEVPRHGLEAAAEDYRQVVVFHSESHGWLFAC